jgi:hypothetical protein
MCEDRVCVCVCACLCVYSAAAPVVDRSQLDQKGGVGKDLAIGWGLGGCV